MTEKKAQALVLYYYGTVVLRSLTACCSGSAICTRGCVLLLGQWCWGHSLRAVLEVLSAPGAVFCYWDSGAEVTHCVLFWKCYLHQGLCTAIGIVVLRSLTACCSGSAICTRGCVCSATPPPPSATPPPSSGPCVAITAGTSVAGPVNSASCKGLAKLRVVLHQCAYQVSQPLKN